MRALSDFWRCDKQDLWARGHSLLNVFLSLPYEGFNVEDTDNGKLEGLEQQVKVEIHAIPLRYTASCTQGKQVGYKRYREGS